MGKESNLTHVVINASELGRRRGGNETYLAGLIEGLTELQPSERVSLLTCESVEAFDVPSALDQVSVGPYRRLPFFLWQQTSALRRLDADWYVSTFFLPLVVPCRQAVLIHDLSFRAHPEYFPFVVSVYMRLLTGLSIRRADCVVTLSDFTLRELARFYPRSIDRAVRVYPGVSRLFHAEPEAGQADVLDAYGLELGYILAMGNIHPRKNLSRLVDAYVRLRQDRPSAPQMVWVGAPRWGSEALLERARAAGVILTGFVAEQDLPALYRAAAMLVYPSLYEGFGLPPAEAMACGTPVITSNTTSLPEVVGQAALTVDPTDVRAIAQAMARLLDDAVLRQELIEAGFQRSQGFTWSRASYDLLAALQGACYNRS
jgi:glycosyltransferase involved in cell wall biosynthesis